MTPFATSILLASLLSLSGPDSKQPATPEALRAEKETRYLAFQIFTYYIPEPKVAALLSSGSKEQGGAQDAAARL